MQEDGGVLEQTQCAICGELTETKNAIRCTENESHCFCDECFGSYCRTAFEEPHGYFLVQQTIAYGMISKVGDLPCPLFRDCNCARIDKGTIAKALSNKPGVLEQWHDAIGRMAVTKAAKEVAATVKAQEEATFHQKGDAIRHILQAVQEVLSESCSVRCTKCNMPGQKNDACMHITCDSCTNRWCYCCGRNRHTNSSLGCTTCDSNGMFLEQDGKSFALQGESNGYGALHEFHRRRAVYFLSRLKEVIPARLWEEFQRKHHNQLTNVPTTVRQIAWEELHPSSEPPVFGSTRPDMLEWLLVCNPIISRLEKALSGPQSTLLSARSEGTKPSSRWASRFRSKKGKNVPPTPVHETLVDQILQNHEDDAETTVAERELLVMEILDQVVTTTPTAVESDGKSRKKFRMSHFPVLHWAKNRTKSAS